MAVTKFMHPKTHSLKSLQILILMKPYNTKCRSLFMYQLFSKEVAFFGCFSCTLDACLSIFWAMKLQHFHDSVQQCGLRNCIHHTQAGHVPFSRKNTFWPQEMQSSWLYNISHKSVTTVWWKERASHWSNQEPYFHLLNNTSVCQQSPEQRSRQTICKSIKTLFLIESCKNETMYRKNYIHQKTSLYFAYSPRSIWVCPEKQTHSYIDGKI